MASYTIPEEITGIPLFVPDTYDFFSIESAGMPNGDDCLKVLGGTDRSYKAFQNAQTLSPNAFLSRTSEWAMSFWFKGGNITPAGAGVRSDEVLFGVMTAAWTGSVDGSTGSSGPAFDYVWFVGHYSAGGGSSCGIGFVRGKQQINPGQIDTQGVGAADAANTWKLVTINVTADGPASLYLDDATSGATGSDPINGGIGMNAGQKLGVGSYSTAVGPNGRQGDWYLGKLAFHDHVLNSTERALLYHAMVG